MIWRHSFVSLMKTPRHPRLLTSDKLPFMVLLFGFSAGLVFIIASILVLKTFETWRSLEHGAPQTAVTCSPTIPPECTEYNVRHDAIKRASIGVMLAMGASLLWMTGMRYRFVLLKDDGNVLIRWGKLLPITLHRYPAAGLTNFTVTKEHRYVVSPIPGTSVQRVRRAPDRWRLTAILNGKKVNLGSYTTEMMTQEARQAIVQAESIGQ